VTQRGDVCPEYLACILCAPLALFIKETERHDEASMAIETSAQVSLNYRIGNDSALEAILWDALESKETWAEMYSAGSEWDTLRTMTDKTPIIQSAKASPDKIIPTLTQAQIARIAAYGRARRVRRGEVLVEAGIRTTRLSFANTSSRRQMPHIDLM
jgi:hypothetical protein